MALQVWLPLTKDLRNQGLSNISVINNGATYSSTGGKLGGCYTFSTASYQKISFPYSLANCTEFTVCLWIKPVNTTITGCLFTFTNPSDYWQFVVAPGNKIAIRDSATGETGTRKEYTLGDFTSGAWTHLAISYNTGTVKIYKNGILFSTNSTGGSVMNNYSGTNAAIGEAITNSSSYYTEGSVNDFRVYDSCLSEQEIKKIAQGLVLHYHLNKNGWGQENLIVQADSLNKNRPFTNSDYSTKGAMVTCPANTNTIVLAQTGTFNTYRWFNGYANLLSITSTELLTPGQPWIFSVDIKSEVTGTFNLWMNIRTTNSDVAAPNVSGNAQSGVNLPSDWTRYWVTIIPRSEDSERINLLMGISGTATSSGTIYFKNLKFERGNIPTSWCPSSTETLGITLGLNSTIEQDYSGFGNNSSYSELPTVISDSSKYNVSSFFGAVNTPNLILNSPTNLLPVLNNCSIAWWEKCTTTSNTLLFSGQTQYYYIAAGNASNPLYDYNIGTSGITLYKDGVAVTTAYSGSRVNHAGTFHIQNEWHHYVLTGIDLSAWTTFKINSYSSWPTNAYLSDVRIYATALSAKDVLSLYNNGAYIDDNNKIYGEIR